MAHEELWFQISYLKDGLSAIQMQTLRHKSALLEEKLELQQKQLREGGLEAWKGILFFSIPRHMKSVLRV